ncbi:hypothetical protein [Sinorhizobium psoraleae]|uniref:Uncharacterized protein n=1 Tax=Sinorhizobium psoraleae TaxID=520838 RepID=A0ABT4KBM2_9HYPH|nr:hypothetical protein [Sinorhizobium psoraleae]MCZ4089358.1 hypothetical protein [Sinorhizobium psoraleae]
MARLLERDQSAGAEAGNKVNLRDILDALVFVNARLCSGRRA